MVAICTGIMPFMISPFRLPGVTLLYCSVPGSFLRYPEYQGQATLSSIKG
jgi:hypothetical protein